MNAWLLRCFLAVVGVSLSGVLFLPSFRKGRANITLRQDQPPRMMATMPENGEETLAEYVWRQCQRGQVQTPSQYGTLYHHLLVDDQHKALYCYIPKVACSNWRRVLLVLTGRLNMSEAMHVNPHRGRYLRWLPSLGQFNQSAIRHRLHTYFKFVFVRNPFERLLSAWRNKFQSDALASAHFRSKHVHRILLMYPHIRNTTRSTNSSSPVVDKVKIRFEDFLQYVVDVAASQSGQMNEHWDYYHRLCRPCLVHYDFVGLYDRLERDAAHVLNVLNVSRKVQFPARSLKYYHKPTSLVMKMYQTVSASLLRRVFELYETDFTLFNFSALQQ